jgi:hypothetical protein
MRLMDRFRYLARREQLMIGDYSIADGGNGWVAPMEVIARASLASFRNAMQAQAENYGLWQADEYDHDDRDEPDPSGMANGIGSLMVSPVPASEFDADYSVCEPVTIAVLSNGQIILDITVGLDDVDKDDLRQLLTPQLARSGAFFVDAWLEGSGTQAYCEILVDFSRRGATVEDAIAVGLDVVALVDRMRDGDLTAETALDLLTAGRADLLVGHVESTWLEAKREGYDLNTDHGRIELAQDVARFANGDNPGLLVLGLQTRKTRGEEVIAKTCPALDAFDTGRYHRAIDAKLFPPVQGLVVRDVPVRLNGGRSGHILAIYVPTQAEELKPFLVHGAVVNGKVEGAFISIVQRRGEHSIPVTAPGIHATIAAGRALLRRGEVPTSDNG